MRRKRSTSHPAASEPRPARRIHGEAPGKLREPAECPGCGASYRKGRWTWQAAPAGSDPHLCPACDRIASSYPAGVLHIAGGFAAAHRDELIGLLRNIEEREREEHPLKRIMAVTPDDAGLEVTVTDAKLALSFGRALQKAYDGSLEQPPTTSEKENLVRVRWTRD